MLAQLQCPKCGKAFPNPFMAGPFVVSKGNATQCPDPNCAEIIEIPDSGGPADFKLSRLRELDHAYQIFPKTPELARVCDAFTSNMHRVVATGMLPGFVLFQWGHYVEHKTGRMIALVGPNGAGQTSVTPIIIPFDIGGFPDELFWEVPHDGTRFAIESMLASMILGTWTAFETLAGDLWVDSLNACPAFASLSGAPKNRIAKQCEATFTRQESEDEEETSDELQEPPEKWLSLEQVGRLSKGSYNLGTLMGSVHRASGSVKFTTLTSIREAYSRAFAPPPQTIDKALSTKALDGLALVRNLIVHRAGRADRRYVDGAKAVKDVPQLKENEPLQLDGAVVCNLLNPVIEASVDLVEGVDTFIAAKRIPKNRP
jgi:hypothetical protein